MCSVFQRVDRETQIQNSKFQISESWDQFRKSVENTIAIYLTKVRIMTLISDYSEIKVQLEIYATC